MKNTDAFFYILFGFRSGYVQIYVPWLVLSVENPWPEQLVSGIIHVFRKFCLIFCQVYRKSLLKFTVLKSKFHPKYISARQAKQTDHFVLHQAILENHCYRSQILVSIAPSYCSP